MTLNNSHVKRQPRDWAKSRRIVLKCPVEDCPRVEALETHFTRKTFYENSLYD